MKSFITKLLCYYSRGCHLLKTLGVFWKKRSQISMLTIRSRSQWILLPCFSNTSPPSQKPILSGKRFIHWCMCFNKRVPTSVQLTLSHKQHHPKQGLIWIQRSLTAPASIVLNYKAVLPLFSRIGIHEQVQMLKHSCRRPHPSPCCVISALST